VVVAIVAAVVVAVAMVVALAVAVPGHGAKAARPMSNGAKAALLLALWVVLAAGPTIGVIWVAIHFLRKFW
jgi:hypothetical protein